MPSSASSGGTIDGTWGVHPPGVSTNPTSLRACDASKEDDGLSWPWQRHLEEGDGHCLSNNSEQRLNREYSYPSLRQTADGALHLAYTVFRQHIRHARVMPDWVKPTN